MILAGLSFLQLFWSMAWTGPMAWGMEHFVGSRNAKGRGAPFDVSVLLRYVSERQVGIA